MAGTWGGKRAGAGRRPNPNAARPTRQRPALRAEPRLKPTIPAEPAAPPSMSPDILAQMLPAIEELSKRYGRQAQSRTRETSPFKLPAFPKKAVPEAKLAMDSQLAPLMTEQTNAWLAGDLLGGVAGEGLAFLGYTYLSELAQRPEYRVMSETIADDATRRWIDFDVVGDEAEQAESKKRAEADPIGEHERKNDPDEKRKRIEAAGKMDRVKQLQEHQEEIRAQFRFYEQCKNDGFFGRTHMYLDIRTQGGEPATPDENKAPIGNGRDNLSKTKCPIGAFKGLRTVEPVWSYPLMYNATNPLLADWYNPQVWYVMGQEVHGSRFLTFIGRPVPDMLKPAYAFGGLSLTQMAQPYVDIWLQTRSSVAALIHSFSVMVLSTDLVTQLQPGNVGALMARVAMFNMLRDNQGTYVINKNTEDFKNVSTSLSGLHELQSQSQEHMASVARIPLVKFTGIQPAGLNADSEGVIQIYDDTIVGYQNRFMRPHLTTVIDFEHLHLWGEIDPQIGWDFRQLRELTEEQKAELVKKEMETRIGYIDGGVVSPEEVRQVVIDDPNLPFAGLNPEDVPEPPAEGFEDGEGGGPGAGDPGGGGEKDTKPDSNDFGKGGGFDGVTPFAGAADEAAFEESKHPRDAGGKFTSGGGSSGAAAGASAGEKTMADSGFAYVSDDPTLYGVTDPAVKHVFEVPSEDKDAFLAHAKEKGVQMETTGPLDQHGEAYGFYVKPDKPAASAVDPSKFKSKKELIGHLLTKGTTIKEAEAATGWKGVSMTLQANLQGMKLTKSTNADGETVYKGVPMTDAEKADLKAKAQAAKAKKIGGANPPAPPFIPPKAEPTKPAQAPTAPAKPLSSGEAFKKALPPPTAAEMDQAKKSAKLQYSYMPGEKPSAGGPSQSAAEKLIAEFNSKWAGKEGLSLNQLADKVGDFKLMKSEVGKLADAEKKHIAEEKAEAAAKQAAADAKAKAEKNKKYMEAFGIGEQHAEGLSALASMLGKSGNDLISEFKVFEDKAKNLGYPLTGLETAVIQSYSNGTYKAVNAALRKGAWTPGQHVYVSMVNKALSKMPKYKGSGLTRGASLSAEEQKGYLEGHIIQEPALMSTSTGSGFSGNTKFKITAVGKRGASIQKLSHYPGEQEVLFQARTFFKVDKVEGQPGGQMTIHMTEWEEH